MKGSPCRNPAGARTDHKGVGPCWLHGGLLPPVRRKGREILAEMELRKALEGFARPIDIGPEEALLALVREAAGNVAWLGARIDTLVSAAHPADPSRTPRAFQPAGYDKGATLFGPQIELDRDGMEHVVGELERGMLALYNEERERLRKAAKDAISAGVAKRQVELAEQQGQTIVIVVNRVLSQMGLDEAKQVVARELLAQEFRQLSGQEVAREPA